MASVISTLKDSEFAASGCDDVPFAVDSRHVRFNELDKLRMFAGTASARIGVSMLTHPFALLKTRAQTGDLQKLNGLGSFRLFGRVFKTEGIGGLYRGWLAATFGGLPSQLIYLTTLETVAQLIREGQASLDITLPATASWAMSGLGASLVTNTLQAPVDNISQQQQVVGTGVGVQAQKGGSTGATTGPKGGGSVISIARSLGVRGLYRGYFANVTTYGSLSAILWGTWTQLNTWNHDAHISGFIFRRTNDCKMSEFEKRSSQVVSSWCAAIFAAAVTHPLDQARTRVQVLQPDKATRATSGGSAALTFRGELRRLLSIMFSDRATFWRGYTRRAQAMMISCGFLFPFYDYLKSSSLS